MLQHYAIIVLQDLGAVSSTPPPHVHIEFHSVDLEGFGPFFTPASYPLAGRGVVAISGRNDDDSSAQSNGAGKTSLVSAIFWALKVGWRGLESDSGVVCTFTLLWFLKTPCMLCSVCIRYVGWWAGWNAPRAECQPSVVLQAVCGNLSLRVVQCATTCVRQMPAAMSLSSLLQQYLAGKTPCCAVLCSRLVGHVV